MQVKIKRLNKNIPLPQYQTSGSVAFDLTSAEDVVVAPRDIYLVPTGLVIKTPPGHMLMLATRSSLPLKKGLSFPHGIGIIDQDYCGPEDEVKVQVLNLTDKPVQIVSGDRIAQAVFVKMETAAFEEMKEVGSESRGGFGSTEGYQTKERCN